MTRIIQSTASLQMALKDLGDLDEKRLRMQQFASLPPVQVHLVEKIRSSCGWSVVRAPFFLQEVNPVFRPGRHSRQANRQLQHLRQVLQQARRGSQRIDTNDPCCPP